MITEAELKCLKRFLRFACRFGLIDLDFHENVDRPLLQTKSTWKRRFLFLRTILFFLYFGFSVLRIPTTLEKYQETKKLDGFVIHALVSVYRAALCVFSITAVSHINEIADLVNNTVSLNRKFGLHHFKREFLEPNLREKILAISVWSFCGAGFLAICMYTAESDTPVYVLSVLPFKMRQNYFIYICALIMEILALCDFCVLVSTFFLIEFVFIFSSNYWLKYLCSRRPILEKSQLVTVEMNMDIMEAKNTTRVMKGKNRITGLKKTQNTGNKLKTDEEIVEGNKTDDSLTLYRQLYILNTVQGSTFGQTFLPTIKFLTGVISMMTMYACIKLREFLHIVTYMLVLECTPGLYIILFPITYAMSEMYTYSSKFVSEQLKAYAYARGPVPVRNNKERKLFRRHIRSCPIIKCRIGSLYWMEQNAKATLVQWLISGTTFLLLTYK